jgi:hypothetical protein
MTMTDTVLLADEDIFERRSRSRTVINRGALIFYTGKAGVGTCTVRDVTNHGAGIRLHEQQVMPVDLTQTALPKSAHSTPGQTHRSQQVRMHLTTRQRILRSSFLLLHLGNTRDLDKLLIFARGSLQGTQITRANSRAAFRVLANTPPVNCSNGSRQASRNV